MAASSCHSDINSDEDLVYCATNDDPDFCSFLYDETPVEGKQWKMPDYREGRSGSKTDGGGSEAYVTNKGGELGDFDFHLDNKRLQCADWPVLEEGASLRSAHSTCASESAGTT